MSNHLVSIIITNYNHGKFLRNAIESALNQTYKNTEVIVIDDGSTDNSREIILTSGDRIKYVFKPNGGQASAFNAGFSLCNGDIVIFLDADDELFPETVQEVIKVWESDITKVQYRLGIIDEDGKRLQGVIPPGYMPSGYLKSFLISFGLYPSPPTSGNAWSRKFLSEILPMPEQEWRICADAYLILLSAIKGNIISIDKILGLYRQHSGNLWSYKELTIKNLKRNLEHDLLKERLIKSYLEDEVPDSLYLNFVDHIVSRIALFRLSKRDYMFKDSLTSLIHLGIKASLNTPWLSSIKRILYISYFLLVPFLPKRAILKITGWILSPSSRPAWLQRIARM